MGQLHLGSSYAGGRSAAAQRSVPPVHTDREASLGAAGYQDGDKLTDCPSAFFMLFSIQGLVLGAPEACSQPPSSQPARGLLPCASQQPQPPPPQQPPPQPPGLPPAAQQQPAMSSHMMSQVSRCSAEAGGGGAGRARLRWGCRENRGRCRARGGRWNGNGRGRGCLEEMDLGPLPPLADLSPFMPGMGMGCHTQVPFPRSRRCPALLSMLSSPLQRHLRVFAVGSGD